MERSRVKVKAIVILLLAFSIETSSRVVENDSSTSQKPFIASRQENLVIDLKNENPSNDFQPVKKFQNPVMENLLINAIKSSAAMVSQIEGINKYAIMLNSSDRKKVDVHLLPTKTSSSYKEAKNLYSDSGKLETSSSNVDAVLSSDDLTNSILKKRQENSRKFLEGTQNETKESFKCECNKTANASENSNHVHDRESHISSDCNLKDDINKNSLANELQREITTLSVFTKLTELEQNGESENKSGLRDSNLSSVRRKIIKKIDHGENLPIENLFNTSRRIQIPSNVKNVQQNISELDKKNIQSTHSRSEEGNDIKNFNLNNESDSRGKIKFDDATVKVNKVKFSDSANHSSLDQSIKNNINAGEKENYPDLNLFKKAVNEASHKFASHKIPDFLLNAYSSSNEFEDSTYESTTLETTTLETTTTNLPNIVLDDRENLKVHKSLSAKVGGFLRDDLLTSPSERPKITQHSEFDLDSIEVRPSGFINEKNPKRLENKRVRDPVTHPAYLRKVTKIIKRPALPLDNVDMTTDFEYSTPSLDIISTSYVDFATNSRPGQETTTPKTVESSVRSAFSSRPTVSPITYVRTISSGERGNRGSNSRHSLNAGFLNISDSISENENYNVQEKQESANNEIFNRRKNSRLTSTTEAPTTTIKYRTTRIPSYSISTFPTNPNLQETTTRKNVQSSSNVVKYSSKTITSDRGHQKYVPSKFETISPFITDSHVKKIYSETGELIEENNNPEFSINRGNLRFINFTREQKDNESVDDVNEVSKVSPTRSTIRTSVNSQNIQGSFSSKFNENTNGFTSRNKLNLFENNLPSSTEESNKFSTTIRSRGKSRNQFSSYTDSPTTDSSTIDVRTTTFNFKDSTEFTTVKYIPETTTLRDFGLTQKNKYQPSFFTTKSYYFGNNQETTTDSNYVDQYQTTENSDDVFSTTESEIGSTFGKTLYDNKQSNSINFAYNNYVSPSSARYDEIKTQSTPSIFEQNGIKNSFTESQFSRTNGLNYFTSDVRSTNSGFKNNLNQQFDFSGSTFKSLQDETTNNYGNYENSFGKVSVNKLTTTNIPPTTVRFGTTDNFKIKPFEPFNHFNTNNKQENEVINHTNGSVRNNSQDIQHNLSVKSTDNKFNNAVYGEARSQNRNQTIFDETLNLKNTNDGIKVSLESSHNSTITKPQFNYAANTINLSLNPPNDLKTTTRSNLVPGESGFNQTQSGKSTLHSFDNSQELTLEQKKALTENNVNTSSYSKALLDTQTNKPQYKFSYSTFTTSFPPIVNNLRNSFKSDDEISYETERQKTFDSTKSDILNYSQFVTKGVTFNEDSSTNIISANKIISQDSKNIPESSTISSLNKNNVKANINSFSNINSESVFTTKKPANVDLQHGASSSDRLASSFIGKQSEESYQISDTDLSSDLNSQERGSKKYAPTKFETISPYLTDSHLKNLYTGQERNQVGKNFNTIEFNEGTLTIEGGDLSSKDPNRVGNSKTSKTHFRGNVKYHWDPANIDWSINDGDFPSQFSYNYNTPEGIMAYQKGVLREINNQKVFIIKGSYQYTAPDGSPVVVNYTADEHGFHPEVVTPVPLYAQEVVSKSNVQVEDEVENEDEKIE